MCANHITGHPKPMPIGNREPASSKLNECLKKRVKKLKLKRKMPTTYTVYLLFRDKSDKVKHTRITINGMFV